MMASVLSQSFQENTLVEPSDETDLRQFDEIMDVGDTPLDDLRPLGDATPPVDLPRHASIASSLDECESTITHVSASEATTDKGPELENVEMLTNVSADAPEYNAKQTKYRNPKVDPKTGRARSPAKAFTRMSDLRRDTAARSAYLSTLNIVNEMIITHLHLGSKEVPDAQGLPLKEPPMLDKATEDDQWLIKDFEPILESGNKATALQIAVGYQNMQKGYPPRHPMPCSEFYKSQPGQIADSFDYQSIFRTLDEKTAGNARMVIVHDSCYPTESLPDLVHPDTLTVSMPRATLLEMANTTDSIRTQVECDPSILLLVGGMELIRKEFPSIDRANDTMTETQVERIVELFLKQIERIRQLRDQKKIPAATILVALPGLSYYSADTHGVFLKLQCSPRLWESNIF